METNIEVGMLVRYRRRAERSNYDRKMKSPDELGAAHCSLLIDCTEDIEEFRARKPHARFCAWKGRDFWHQNIKVQVRLEKDGSIFLSTQEGHVSTLRTATITIEQLHALIRGVTANVPDQATAKGKH